MNANDFVMLGTIAVYLLGMLSIGIYYMKKNNSADDF